LGEGITTAVAMVIAEEMELPLGKVNMTLADARPELVFNQLTGGSNSIHSLYQQVRVAAATARGQLASSAAKALGTPLPKLRVKDGVILGGDGRAMSYGSLAAATGGKRFAMDLEVPGAMPTMVCLPPTINGSAVSVRNAKRVRAMPGVTDVAIIPHTKSVPGGVAVLGARQV
jgi:isoquinoline 1-oxidoreductase beta subunit